MKTTTITVTTYKFSELSKAAKQRAIDNQIAFDTEYDWWQQSYQDAQENAGIEIKSFDIDRREIDFQPATRWEDAANAMVHNWGDQEDAEPARQYLQEIDRIRVVELLSDDIEEREEDYDGLTPEERTFRDALHGILLNSLKAEYEYRTSEEYAIEAIEANDRDYNEEGEIA